MGVERAVTRWYALRQPIQQEIDALQQQLDQSPTAEESSRERAEVEQQLKLAQARLLALGPCPKPMMG